MLATNKNSVSALINKTEGKYNKCWRILAGMKPRSGVEISADELLEFQPILCDALFVLERAYRAILNKEKRLIEGKAKLTPAWFQGRMKCLAIYRDVIKEAISIGKSLGDAYAWFFYQHEPGYLLEHSRHARHLHLPGGIGGIGEYEFAKSVRSIAGKLLIYHGTTTILRLGDVSLIDLKTLRVSALGELKTEEVAPGKLRIRLVLIGPKSEEVSLADPSPAPKRSAIKRLPIAVASKLKRQVDQMTSAVATEVGRKYDSTISTLAITYMSKLDELMKSAKRGRFCYAQAGDGLLLAVYSMYPSMMYTRIAGRGDMTYAYKLKDLPIHAKRILSHDRDRNRLHLSALHFSESGPSTMLGSIPLFWWPLELENLRKIIFQEALVVSILNTVHLIEKLEDAGFRVSFNQAEREYQVQKALGGRTARLEHFSYFLHLVQQNLFTEEKIIEILMAAISELEARMHGRDGPVNVRMDLHINQRLFRQ